MGMPFDVSDVVGSLVAAVVLIVAKWAFDKLSFWDEKIGLMINRAELRKVELLRADPVHITHFLLLQGHLLFRRIGYWADAAAAGLHGRWHEATHARTVVRWSGDLFLRCLPGRHDGPRAKGRCLHQASTGAHRPS